MPRTYATGDRLALLAWATAQKFPAHPAGKHSRAPERVKFPACRVPPSCRRGSPGRDAGGVDRLRHPTRPAPISLQPRSISSGWRYQRDDSGDSEWRMTVDDMNASAWPNGWQVREPAGHGINFPQATESGNLKSIGIRLFSGPLVTSQGSCDRARLSGATARSCVRPTFHGWLLDNRAAPSEREHPPCIAVNRLGGCGFSALLLNRHFMPWSASACVPDSRQADSKGTGPATPPRAARLSMELCLHVPSERYCRSNP